MNLVGAYLADCELRGLSPLTIRIYSRYVTGFIGLVQKKEQITSTGDVPALAEFLRRYGNDRTRSTAYRSVRCFIRWAAKHGMGTDWLAEYHPRFAAAPQSSIISVNEFYVIMGVIPNSRRGCRDKALYTTIFYTGARRDAIRRLRWADVDLKDRTARIKTKGRKEQLVTIPVPAARSLNLWRLKCPSDTWVFPAIGAKTDRPISGSSVTRQLPRYAKAAGIHKRVYVHLLRHSCATHLVDSGASLDVVQAVLGHASIRTTQIYARMSQKRIAAALDQAFPDIIMKGE